MHPDDWPGMYSAWAVVGWWHRNRPTTQIDFFPVMGPLGPAVITATRPSTWVPEHVKDARTVLGFPRTHRTAGERP